MKPRRATLFLKAATWLLVVNNSTCTSTKLQCFCNTAKCLRAVCTSHYGCYIDVHRQIINKSHVQQKINYGCIEDYNMTIMCQRHEQWTTKKRSQRLPICCSNDDLCNMPLLLKDVMEGKKKKELPYNKRKHRIKEKPCPEVEPAIQLASVILPSILIAVVFLISFLLFTELVRHRKSYVCNKSKGLISPKNELKCNCTGRLSSPPSCDLTSDGSNSTLASILVN